MLKTSSLQLLASRAQTAGEHSQPLMGLCFILDGLDEYRPNPKRNTFIFKLIKKLCLRNAVVIIASRPAASAQLRNSANKEVEVIGFWFLLVFCEWQSLFSALVQSLQVTKFLPGLYIMESARTNRIPSLRITLHSQPYLTPKQQVSPQILHR